MKRILIVTSLALSSLSFGQANFNKMSVDFGWGINKAFTGPIVGKANRKSFTHFDLGTRYMLTNKWGFYGGLMFENYKTTINKMDYTTNSFAIKLEGVMNFTNITDLASFSKKLGVYVHSGPSLVLNMGKTTEANRSYDVDKLAGWTAGVTYQYKVSPKLAVKTDISVVAYLQGERTLDLQYRKDGGLTNGFDGSTGFLTFGANYYLGDKAEHADWTPTQYGDMEAMAALKAKIEKAEKDMMDDDKDGVPNYLDQEPGTAAGANVDTKGKTVKVEKVVDMDGDGVLDVNDFCPTIKGAASANGCPDKDGDRIYDFADKCPNAAGLAADGGCPVVKQKEKEIMQKAMAGVQFDNGKATIIKKSTPILDQVAKVMLENPTYNLAINGHTDNAGDPGKNLQLSIDRAKSVKAYLMGKGVAESRLTSNGYGDTQPKASNATAKGKALNRRVEFIVSFEQ
jgi:outer membrane protein OmpA-like peptidoglycan-associated protein